MANNRDGKLENIETNGLNLTELPKNIIVDAMNNALTNDSYTKFVRSLSRVNKKFHAFFREDLAEQQLCQAVIDDNRKMVKQILDSRPDLLLKTPPKNFMIESKLTWQRLIAEKPAVMAAKRNQLEMFKLILPYYDQLLAAAKNEQEKEVIEKAKAEVIAAWRKHPTQKNAQGTEYSTYIKSLIDTFAQETFPNGNDQYGHGQLSAQTESALEELFNKLLPETAVKLDNYVDVELLLLAAYKTYWDHFNTFKNWG